MRPEIKLVILFFSFLIAPLVRAATVTLKIETESAKQNFLFVMSESDPVSQRREVLQKFDINGALRFEVKFDLDEVTQVFLRLGWVEYPLFAEPGATYDLLLPEPGREVARSFAVTARVSPVFKTIKTDELNYLIAAVNRRYDAFFEEHYMEFAYENLRGNDAWKRSEGERLKKLNWATENPDIKPVNSSHTDSLLMAFSASLQAEFASFQRKNFFSTYLRFTLADLDRMRKWGNNEIFNSYFKDYPLELRNPAYVHMLRWFNRDFVFRWCERAQAEEFVKAFESGSFMALDTLFAKTTWYGNPDFRHVSLLMALERDLLIMDTQRMKALNEAEQTVKVPLKPIAQHIISNKKAGKRGEPAPPFKLTDHTGVIKELSEFSGKHIYINFYASWCASCMAEMRQIAALRKAYGKHVEFISISMDEQYEDFKDFVLKSREMGQKFLFGSQDPEFLETWQIRSVPRYMLLDREGRIIRFEAQSPTGGIEKELEKIKNEAEKKPKNGAWN